jgi:hypothetical protein
MALKVHREALTAIRSFWEALQHPVVRFQVLATAIKSMDVTSECMRRTASLSFLKSHRLLSPPLAAVRHADRVYRQVPPHGCRALSASQTRSPRPAPLVTRPQASHDPAPVLPQDGPPVRQVP